MSLRYLQRALCTAFRTASGSAVDTTMQQATAAACGVPQHARPAAYTRLGQQQQRFGAPCVHRRRIATTTAAAASQQQQGGPSPPVLDLETVLARVRTAVQGSQPLCRAQTANDNGMVFGEGVHMGLPVAWAFIWRPDGAWYEEVRSQHLTYKWGYDGAGTCWEVDPYGVSKVLEKDDHESTVLGALIRSGNWLVPELAAQHLHLELEGPLSSSTSSSNGSSSHPAPPVLNMPPVAATWDVQPCPHGAAAGAALGAGGPVAAAVAADGGMQQQWQQQCADSLHTQLSMQEQQQWGSSSSSSSRSVAGNVAAAAVEQAPDTVGSSVSSSSSSSSGSRSRRRGKDSGAAVFLTLRLKTGKMVARIQVNATTWRPEGYRQPFCSDTEAWVFEEWNNWTLAQRQQQQQQQQQSGGSMPSIADVFYPRRVTHMLCKGTANSYTTHGGITRGAEVHTAYALPASPPVPIDVQYMESVSPQVPAWQTHQGHLLVEAHLNGRKAGWMLLDTGASGFVIEPCVAQEFRLPAFGDLSIAGVAGKVPTRYRRATQLRVGPLVLSDPIMLEMSISRIVGAFHEHVIGIVGYDVFRRCRVTLPCHNTRKAIQKAVSRGGRVTIYSPEKDTPAAAMQAAHPWPPTAAEQQQLAAMAALQQGIAAAAAGLGGHGGGIGSGAAAAAAAAAAAVVAAVPAAARSRRRSSSSSAQPPALKRRRARAALSRSTAAATAAAAASAAATAVLEPPQEQQQQQHAEEGGVQPMQPSLLQQPSVLQQVAAGSNGSSSGRLLELPPVPVPPPNYSCNDEPLPTALIEVLLHKPVIRAPHEFEDGYIWQDIVMIASLPHVELEFVVPGRPNTRHKSLFLVDSGAGGAEVMFHSRAARELGLLDHEDEQYKGWGEGLADFRTVSGVGDFSSEPNTSSSSSSANSSLYQQHPQQQPSSGGAGVGGAVGCQAGKLPELVIRGQSGSDPSTLGSLQLRGVRALFNKAGGLDISLYSAGMVCADLLSRMQVVFDYPNKRIGWKVPPPGALAQLRQQEQQQQQQQQR